MKSASVVHPFKLFAFFVFLAGCYDSPAFHRPKTFEVTVGFSNSSHASCAFQTKDRGFIVGGSTEYNHPALAKINQYGFLQWKIEFEEFGMISSVSETKDGFTLITSDYLTTDKSGTKLSSKPMISSIPVTVARHTDGTYLVSGWTPNFPAAPTRYFAVFDEQGEPVFSRNYAGLYGDDPLFMTSGTALKPVPGGYLAVAAEYENHATNGSTILIKLDSVGSVVWEREFAKVTVTKPFLNIMPSGLTVILGDGDGFFIQHTTPNGDSLFSVTKSLLGTVENVITAQNKTDLIVLFTTPPAGNRDILITQMSVSGEIVWSRTYGDSLYDFGSSVIPTTEGGYLITGYKNRPNGLGTDMYILKVDAEGRLAESP